MEFQDIERERLKHKIPLSKLCNAAGVSVRTYERARSGLRAPRQDTVAKLAAAIGPARKGEKSVPSQKLFRLVAGMMAVWSDIDIDDVLAHDPQQKATADPRWMAISRIRTNTVYVLHVVMGMPNSEVARAAGISQAAVTIGVQRMEGKRDIQGFDAILSQLEKAVMG